MVTRKYPDPAMGRNQDVDRLRIQSLAGDSGTRKECLEFPPGAQDKEAPVAADLFHPVFLQLV